MDSLKPTSEPLSDLPPELECVEGRNSIDYMLRTTKQHLSGMFHLADQKASIVTGLTMVMLTLIFGFIQSNGLTISLGVLGLSVFCAAVIALTAAMPSRTARGKGVRTPAHATFNPLFFGHATELSESEYVEKMAHILTSNDRVYHTILRDLYQMSMVAERKFRKVRLAYRILFVGLLLTTAAVIWEHWERILALFA